MNEAIKPKSKEDEGEYGYEGDMAMSQLRSIIRNSQQLLEVLDPKTDLPEWVQSKITLAKDYIETSANYLMSELEEGYDGPERRKNNTARKFIDALQQRALQRAKTEKQPMQQKPLANKVAEEKSVVHPSGRRDPGKEDERFVVANRTIDPSKGRYDPKGRRHTANNSPGYLQGITQLQTAQKLAKEERYISIILEKKRNAKKKLNITNMDPELNNTSAAIQTTPTMDASSPEAGKI